MAGTTSDDDFAISDINVTPFVDVMLVLLIIFMVTATYIVKEAIEIELPETASGENIEVKSLEIMISREGIVYVNGKQTDDDDLINTIQNWSGRKENIQAIISADRAASHGSVVHILDILKTEGITKFAIQIDRI